MKKIAFITNGHTGSTLPLAKRFLKLGYTVDFFMITNQIINSTEALKTKSIQIKHGIHKIDVLQAEEIYSFMDSDQFNLFYLAYPRPYKRIPILRNFINIAIYLFFRKLCRQINHINYSAINLIGRDDLNIFILFHKYLSCKKIITSLHEVCNHKNPDFKQSSELLGYLLKNKKQIVVHSKKTLTDILAFKNAEAKNINHINFGLFETFITIPHVNLNNLPQKFILFYGSINPYKGLSVLYDAVSNNQYLLNDIKIVIAGKGNDPILKKIIFDERFVVFNHFLSNEELVELNKKALFIVCPYISVSQSGIPQTTFVFNKPIIASNIGSFPEIIKDKENGLLFETGNANDLAKKIEMLINNPDLYLEMINNINIFEVLHFDYSWSHIVKQYSCLLTKQN